MKITSQQYAQALYEAVHQTKDSDHNLVLDNFIKILTRNGDLEKHSEIEREYKIIDAQKKGIQAAKVTVAREMEINSSLMNQLNEIIGSKVEINKKVNERIVGGVIVRVGDTLIDASVKTQLNNLKNQLDT